MYCWSKIIYAFHLYNHHGMSNPFVNACLYHWCQLVMSPTWLRQRMKRQKHDPKMTCRLTRGFWGRLEIKGGVKVMLDYRHCLLNFLERRRRESFTPRCKVGGKMELQNVKPLSSDRHAMGRWTEHSLGAWGGTEPGRGRGVFEAATIIGQPQRIERPYLGTDRKIRADELSLF